MYLSVYINRKHFIKHLLGSEPQNAYQALLIFQAQKSDLITQCNSKQSLFLLMPP